MSKYRLLIEVKQFKKYEQAVEYAELIQDEGVKTIVEKIEESENEQEKK